MSNCKVIALTNQKGGVGKTTTAVNLGVSLVQQGKKVLLIDADAQANLTMALGYNRPDDIPITLSTVMQNIIDDKTLDVSQGIIHHSEGVDLLPSNIEMSGFEVRLINAMSRERVLKTYVNEVKKNYDYVLIDCMPSLGMITINALAAADSVIIPTQPHYLSAKGLELLLRSVSMVKRQINPKLRIDGILMTMVMPRTNISKEITANRITQNRAKGRNTFIFIDEIYLLFQHEYSANFLFTLWKRVRKYGAYCTGITQNVDDLLQSHTARTMLANSEFIIMLNQASTDRLELAKLLNISDLQMSYITNVGAGQGLLKVGSSLVPFVNKFPRNTELYKLMTTKFGEV